MILTRLNLNQQPAKLCTKKGRMLILPFSGFGFLTRCQSTKALATAAQSAHISFAIFGIARVFGGIAGFVADLAIGAIAAVHIHKHLLNFESLLYLSTKKWQKISGLPAAPVFRPQRVTGGNPGDKVRG